MLNGVVIADLQINPSLGKRKEHDLRDEGLFSSMNTSLHSWHKGKIWSSLEKENGQTYKNT